MENESSIKDINTQTFQPDQYKKRTNLVFILLGLGIILILLILVYFFANKQNINPNPTPTSIPTPAINKISVLCPSIKSFCQNKNEVYEKGKAIGTGDLLKIGTPVYAVVDGDVIVRSVTTRVNGKIMRYKKITLKSIDNNLIANYFFESGKVQNSSVKKGDVLFVIGSDDPISYYQKYNLVFQLFDQHSNSILVNEINFL